MAERLPVEVAEELKWFVWNDIWARVNSRLAGQVEGQRRQELQKKAKSDGDRADTHFRKAVAAKSLAKAALHQFRRQVAAVGSAAAAGASEKDSRRAAAVEVLKCPEDLDEALWQGLVEAVKNAAVAANMLSIGEGMEAARPLQLKFEEAWREFEADVDGYYDAAPFSEDGRLDGAGGEAVASAQQLPPRLVSELKWFCWNRSWARVNAELGAQLRSGERAKKCALQAAMDGKRADAHFEVAYEEDLWPEEALRQFRRQVDALAALAAEGLEKGDWLCVARAAALPAPDDVDEELWGELVRGAKCAAVAASVMSREEAANMSIQAEFEEAWQQLGGA